MTVVRTRFAPSPTGSLHVGGVRTALYCLLHAHRHGGKFVLRIEDTDRARSTDEATRGILRDLRWLGLQWDEGPEVGGPGAPYLQSQRRDRYEEIFQTLIEGGHAYWAWETREELNALRLEAALNEVVAQAPWRAQVHGNSPSRCQRSVQCAAGSSEAPTGW